MREATWRNASITRGHAPSLATHADIRDRMAGPRSRSAAPSPTKSVLRMELRACGRATKVLVAKYPANRGFENLAGFYMSSNMTVTGICEIVIVGTGPGTNIGI